MDGATEQSTTGCNERGKGGKSRYESQETRIHYREAASQIYVQKKGDRDASNTHHRKEA